MPEYKPDESAPTRPIFVQPLDKSVNQAEDNESTLSTQKDEKKMGPGILKSIWRGLVGG